MTGHTRKPSQYPVSNVFDALMRLRNENNKISWRQTGAQSLPVAFIKLSLSIGRRRLEVSAKSVT